MWKPSSMWSCLPWSYRNLIPYQIALSSSFIPRIGACPEIFPMYSNCILMPFYYNLSAILPSASASLLRTATRQSAWSFRCSLSNWKLVFWASSWSLNILPFLSKTSINWSCSLVVSSSPSAVNRFRFRPSWDVDAISGFEAGCLLLAGPAYQNPSRWTWCIVPFIQSLKGSLEFPERLIKLFQLWSLV